MAVQDTQNSILVGAAAVAQFVNAVKQHPNPALMAQSSLQLGIAAVQTLSPTSAALPWMQLLLGVISELFPVAQPKTPTVTVVGHVTP